MGRPDEDSPALRDDEPRERRGVRLSSFLSLLLYFPSQHLSPLNPWHTNSVILSSSHQGTLGEKGDTVCFDGGSAPVAWNGVCAEQHLGTIVPLMNESRDR